MSGVLTDPTTLKMEISIEQPESFTVNDNLLDPPAQDGDSVVVERGPNIKPFPKHERMADSISGRTLLVVGDNITTDHIMPAGAKILPFRSNIPKISEFCFTRCDEEFPSRAKAWGGGVIVGGANYGQGSSREHAALAPLYLGVKAVIAKSFARIHAANLINNGILPIVFADPEDYSEFHLGDEITLPDVKRKILAGEDLEIKNETTGATVRGTISLSDRQKKMLAAGGLLNYTKEN